MLLASGSPIRVNSSCVLRKLFSSGEMRCWAANEAPCVVLPMITDDPYAPWQPTGAASTCYRRQESPLPRRMVILPRLLTVMGPALRDAEMPDLETFSRVFLPSLTVLRKMRPTGSLSVVEAVDVDDVCGKGRKCTPGPACAGNCPKGSRTRPIAGAGSSGGLPPKRSAI